MHWARPTSIKVAPTILVRPSMMKWQEIIRRHLLLSLNVCNPTQQIRHGLMFHLAIGVYVYRCSCIKFPDELGGREVDALWWSFEGVSYINYSRSQLSWPTLNGKKNKNEEVSSRSQANWPAYLVYSFDYLRSGIGNQRTAASFTFFIGPPKAQKRKPCFHHNF